jgi:beta-galactosidase
MGAPVDVISEKVDFNAYPFLIVPAYQLIDDSLTGRWKNYASRGGHLIISCRTGYKDRFGRFFEGKMGNRLFDLIGGELAFFDVVQPDLAKKVQLDNRSYSWFTWGEILNPYPGTSVWGIQQDDFYAGRPSILHHQIGKGSVTYVGVDSKDGELEKEVSRKFIRKPMYLYLIYPKATN